MTVTSQDHSFNRMFYSLTKTVRFFCMCKPRLDFILGFFLEKDGVDIKMPFEISVVRTKCNRVQFYY